MTSISQSIIKAKSEVLNKLQIDGQKLIQIKQAFVDSDILDQKIKENKDNITKKEFENDVIKEVGRVHFNEEWYILVKREKSPLIKEAVFFINENKLDEGAKIFLNNYVPTNQVTLYCSNTPEMDKF